jgi:hypothetical protein
MTTDNTLKKRNPTIEDFNFPEGLPTAADLPCFDAEVIEAEQSLRQAAERQAEIERSLREAAVEIERSSREAVERDNVLLRQRRRDLGIDE